jgi:alpha-1,2-mannosyltransferase
MIFDPGLIGLDLNAPGSDWMVFYAAARLFFNGKISLIFNGDALTAYLNSAFSWWLSAPLLFRPWVYPPSYLLMVLPFGALPFVASYLAFQLVSAALLAAALSLDSDRSSAKARVICAALVCPAASVNIAAGQNAFLTAALLIAGLRALRTMPVVGGALLGVLTFKPQFWLLVPIALIAGREWRALAWSVAAAAVLAGISAVVFGIEVWPRWLDLALATYAVPNAKWIEYGRIWGDSVYACLVAGGASETIANAAQVAAALLAGGATYRAFRLPLPLDHKTAILLAGTILAAPHSSLHDTVLLALAAILWTSEGGGDGASIWKWPLALSLWLAPLFNPPLISSVGRFTPILIIAFMGVVIIGRAPSAVASETVAAG